MKKWMSAIIAAFMTLALLAGCGGTSENTTTPEANTETTEAAGSVPDNTQPGENTEAASGDKLKIGFSISERDQFLTKLETALTESANAHNVELTAFDSQQDVQKQMDHIATFASQGFDAIIVNLVDTNTTDTIIEGANGIPVVFVNRLPDESKMVEGKTAYVGSDEKQAGGLQAEFLTGYFNDKGMKDIRYVLLMGILGLPHTSMRTEYAKKGLEDAGFTLEKVFEDTAQFDRAKAMEMMQQFLGTGKEFDVVICNNDEMALGAIEALRAVGISDIPVVGIDATSNAIAAIEAGEMACSVFQNAAGQGSGSIEAAVALANGETVEMYNWVPYELVTKENAAEYKDK